MLAPLPPSQLLGVKGVDQLARDASVAIDGPRAGRDVDNVSASAWRFLKVCSQVLMETVENGRQHFLAVRTRERECCFSLSIPTESLSDPWTLRFCRRTVHAHDWGTRLGARLESVVSRGFHLVLLHLASVLNRCLRTVTASCTGQSSAPLSES
jgi:hypothetical protein